MLSRRRRLVGAAVAVGLWVAAWPAGLAWAETPPGCRLVPVAGHGEGGIRYEVVCPGDGDETTPGDGGGDAPTCDLSGIAEYCIGASACWANVPSALPEDSWPWESQPSPDAIYTYQSCTPDPTGTLTGWSWYTPPEITVGQAARQAYGALRTPAFSIGMSPVRRAVVGLDTWFWAAGPDGGEITGSAALGVVAIGTPASLEVDPGDGSGPRTCAWSVSDGPACAVAYERSSAGQPVGADGLPAYTARMRLVYDVRFTQGGTTLDVAGVPDTLTSGWQTLEVPVAEIEAVVAP
ncbi:hypothetical protein OEB99_09575 [Actinotalea sp. M2MS4P-6]|uniref:hypothetical protein n=1 Tax=Actinotalea sp. M2MS4P-6 TaxID=2983762 RepID=UPI0021E46815|nr:hypothetical protein [Actinotalea sp. M2MS4P-6]MCV2394555.1 hypothetical protein [Actinotalea sp. M2MS4P-6]